MNIDDVDPIDASLDMAHYWAENHTEKEILKMLRVRDGNPHSDWDEDDLKIYKIIRKSLELALTIKRAGTN